VDSYLQTLIVLVALAASAFLGLILTLLLFYGVYWFLTLPMRRSERGRLFLDLLDLGVRQGHTPEQVIVASSWSRDHALGVRFHRLAAELEQGISLGEALKRAPHLVPAEIVGMLQAGERIGNVGRVLPACRKLVADGVSHVRGALNYIVLLTLATLPLVFLGPFLFVKVWPKYREVFEGMDGGFVMPAFTQMVFNHPGYLFVPQASLIVLVLGLTLAYVVGPHLRCWVSAVAPGIPAFLHWLLPWRRDRLRRDFSAMLAVLLDSGVPEVEALSLAAGCTGNQIVEHRVREACRLLASGVPLPEAIRAVDSSREFQWRLANALRGGSGFFKALNGWFQALDARAFRYEQTAAQISTTAVVLLNGLIVGSILIAVFLCLIELTNRAALW